MPARMALAAQIHRTNVKLNIARPYAVLCPAGSCKPELRAVRPSTSSALLPPPLDVSRLHMSTEQRSQGGAGEQCCNCEVCVAVWVHKTPCTACHMQIHAAACRRGPRHEQFAGTFLCAVPLGPMPLRCMLTQLCRHCSPSRGGIALDTSSKLPSGR